MADMSRRKFLKVSAAAAGVVALGAGASIAITQPDEVELPTTQIGEGQMKVLVVYGTKSGCTSGIAEKIGETLAGSGVEVTVSAAENAGAAGGYDAVVVGSGVRAGTWHQAVRTWVTAEAEALKAMPVAFYTCGMTLTQGPEKAADMRGFTDALIAETGVKPIDIGVFAGWFEPKEFSLPERAILKLMKTPQGDFRDWDAIAAWAGAVAPKLGA